MLSILIPVYNQDCTLLLGTLNEQASRLGVEFEIILAEDGSSKVKDYSPLHIPQLIHIIRKENVGRSAIRNFLFSRAHYPLLLMMDCDVCIQKSDFLKNYLHAADTHEVVCGGLIYPSVRPARQFRMRYDYEKSYEKRMTPERLNSISCPPFRSSCFLLWKEVAEKVHFDERFRQYGYEDVKFGKDLREAGYKTFHINNPVVNNDIETNRVYLRKIEESMRVLYEFRDELRSDSRLLRTAEKIRKLHLDWAVKKLRIRQKYYATYIQVYRLKYLLSLMNH